MEKGTPNEHAQEVLPLKRVLLRVMPELERVVKCIRSLIARSRGILFARMEAEAAAESDEAFKK